MPRKRQKRLYTKRGRYYADFRDFADVGGGKEALIPAGERFATASKREAKKIGVARLKELIALRDNRADDPSVDLTRIGDFVDRFLVHRASKPKANYRRLKQLAQQLEYAVAFFGADTKLRHIDTLKVEEYLTHLEKKPRWNREPEPGDEPETITAPTQR